MPLFKFLSKHCNVVTMLDKVKGRLFMLPREGFCTNCKQGLRKPSSRFECLNRALKHEWCERLFNFSVPIQFRVLLVCAVLTHFQMPESVIHDKLISIKGGNIAGLILSNILHSCDMASSCNVSYLTVGIKK